MGDGRAARWEAPLAALGTVFVLAAISGVLVPLADGSDAAGAVVSLVLFVATAAVAAVFGERDRPHVHRVGADVCAAAATFYLASAVGESAVALDVGGTGPPLLAALVALPYAVITQLRRPGPFAAVATGSALVVASTAAVALVDGAPDQAYAAALAADAGLLATVAVRRVLAPFAATATLAALAALSAATALVGADAGGADVALAVLLLALVASATVAAREPSVVGALAIGAPIVVALAAWRTGHGWWSIPLGLAWSGAGVAAIGALTTRHDLRRGVAGVLAWCTVLVLGADLFLTNSSRVHALVALICSAVLFAAAVVARRAAVSVLAGLAVLSAVSRAVTDRNLGSLLLLAAGVALLYFASARRGRGVSG